MNKKPLSGLAAVGLLAGEGSATALAAAGTPAAAASTATVASNTTKAPDCSPLGSLVAKGTITQAQAIAIRNAFISYFHDHWRQVLDTVVGQQVKNHTIAKARASAVTSAITQWTQKSRGEGSGRHGPCHHGHGWE
jgi:hypothetical protein